MVATLNTDAEQRASKAEELSAFSGLKLLNVRRNLEPLLELIGREQIFSEYTRHDISHINQMLSMLEWIVPENTKKIMSSSDWLMTVLAIYFHDFGMIVTRREFERRNYSGFPEYRDNVLFAGDAAADYRAKVATMEKDKAERFLYEEFVRHKHAERIRAWILGQSREQLGISNEVLSEVDALLKPLDSSFRHDLALVCESHHLDDLDDVRKYPVRQPYGNSVAETVNVQYAAVLMRTVDLLHITRDRTPSISFRVINPADPISQEEWAKQMAVTSLRAQIAKDAEGNLDERLPRDTIEIHARFTSKDGFFALASYLLYAEGQLRRSSDLIRTSNKTLATKHEFPWRKLDDSHIQTQGFLRDTFGFTIDEHRILNLLTGHTLYNDTRVVLRELVQNALDAVRLQKIIDERSGATNTGRVTILWNTKDRMLTVMDNGTGMTQGIIERNLLKVGASRYEDPDFKKEYPGFSAISRFGIGILSTFMIADWIEITTCHPEDPEARQLSLRSVHGKYLVQLLDKELNEEAKALAPHGTSLRLKIRHSAELPDIVEIAKRWIVVPDCPVYVIADDDDPIQIGFSSPKEAVEHLVRSHGIVIDDSAPLVNKTVRVEEKELQGVTVAYAVQWSEFFREWSFWPNPAYNEPLLLGTCIEGVRVEFGTPGFQSTIGIVAIANAKGLSAPRTNVARSGLEATPERDALLKSIYEIYCNHIEREIQALHTKRDFSLTWATQEARYLLTPLVRSTHGDDLSAINPDLLTQQLAGVSVLVVERNGSRSAESATVLGLEPHFWTIDSELFRNAEAFIREAPGITSLSTILKAVDKSQVDLPQPILCGSNFRDSSLLNTIAFTGKEVDKIVLHRSERRVDLRWSPISTPERWVRSDSPDSDRNDAWYALQYSRSRDLWIGRGSIEVEGLENEVAIRAFGSTYLPPTTRLAQLLLKYLSPDRMRATEGFEAGFLLEWVSSALEGPWQGVRAEYFESKRLQSDFDTRWTVMGRSQNAKPDFDFETVCDVLNESFGKVFDATVWVRDQKQPVNTY